MWKLLKKDQIYQLLRTFILKIIEFLKQVHSNLKGIFCCNRQDYQYYIFFFEENIGFIDIELFKFKDNVHTVFNSHQVLQKQQLGSKLKIFNTNGGEEYIEQFDDYL